VVEIDDPRSPGSDDAQPPDLRAELRKLWRRKWIVVVPVVLLPIAVYLISASFANVYLAETTLRPPTNPYSEPGGPTEVEVSARVVESRDTLARAARRLRRGAPSLSKLAAEVRAKAQPGVNLLTISVRDPNPRQAAAIANAAASAVVLVRNAQILADLDDTIRQLRAEVASVSPSEVRFRARLQRQLEAAVGVRAALPRTAHIIERARTPGSPISPRPVRDAAVAFVMGGLLGVGLAFLLEVRPRPTSARRK
jgi:tyrosine-protein kinase